MANNCGTPESLDGRGCIKAYLKEVIRVLFVPRYKNDGSRFEFDNLAAITSTSITEAMNDSEIYDRMFSSNKYSEYLSERGEDEIYDAGYFKVKLDDSGKTISFVDAKGDSVTKAAYDKLSNGVYDVFLVDKNGTLRAYYDETRTKIRPLPVIEGGISATQMDYSKADSKPEHVAVTISLDPSVVDERIFDTLTDALGFNILEYTDPLIQGSEYFTQYEVPTTTSVNVQLRSTHNIALTGLTVSDVTGEIVGGAALTISAVDEDTDNRGNYTITYSTATSADVLEFAYARDGIAFDSINKMQTEPIV